MYLLIYLLMSCDTANGLLGKSLIIHLQSGRIFSVYEAGRKAHLLTGNTSWFILIYVFLNTDKHSWLFISSFALRCCPHRDRGHGGGEYGWDGKQNNLKQRHYSVIACICTVISQRCTSRKLAEENKQASWTNIRKSWSSLLLVIALCTFRKLRINATTYGPWSFVSTKPENHDDFRYINKLQ